jgi:hypothetical protein
MTLPRSRYVHDGQEGVYHCFSRCVRRAFLCGFDPFSKKDFSHRKKWLVDRLKFLSSIFAIDVCAYAVMDNHYHTVLRTRPDILASWPDQEIAKRWLTLFPQHHDLSGSPLPPDQKNISALTDSAQRIAQLRLRLCSLSWFMGRLNEFIARSANKEDNVKGKFWESRFKSQTLLDDAATAACMAYVDLNLIRAGLASSPEDCNFTSIQERIRTWYHDSITSPPIPPPQISLPLTSPSQPPNTTTLSSSALYPIFSLNSTPASTCWLCPIQSDPLRRGILHLTAPEYFILLNHSARMLRSNNLMPLHADIIPILLRLRANPDAWIDTISHFGSKFRLAAGLLPNLRRFANQLGRHWLKGLVTARLAFAP